MIVASVGVGSDADAHKAGAEASTQALSGLPDKKASILFVFGSVTYDQDKLIEGVTASAPGVFIFGCSTAGEISSEGFSSEKSVVVLAVYSDTVKFWGALGNHLIWNSKLAGEELANKLEYDSHGYVTSALLFLDIIVGNSDAALRGLLGRLGSNFPIFGGAASDDMLFYETFQYLENKVYTGSVVGLGISGDYTAAGVAMHGFLPIGIERIVTRSEGTTLYELDSKPAASIYEEYFGEEHVSELHEGLLPTLAVSYPLGVFATDSNEVVLRHPVFVDQKGAMTFTAPIPQGAEVRLMISDIERGLEVAELAARGALLKLGGKKPKAAIIVNSVARKKMLGIRADEEIEVIQRVIGRDVPMVGFYSYAQIGGKIGEETPFHNGSLLVWLLAE